MYSPIGAFDEVISGKETGSAGSVCHIRRISKSDAKLENGIEYCFVEIVCSNGTQYGIEAFGPEAVELRRRALVIRSSAPYGYPSPLIKI